MRHTMTSHCAVCLRYSGEVRSSKVETMMKLLKYAPETVRGHAHSVGVKRAGCVEGVSQVNAAHRGLAGPKPNTAIRITKITKSNFISGYNQSGVCVILFCFISVCVTFNFINHDLIAAYESDR